MGHASAAFVGGVLWVAGGVTGTTTTARVWAVDPSTGKVRLAASLPAPRSNAGTVVVNGTAYLLGGEGPAGPVAPLGSVVELRVGRRAPAPL
ncbi:MAG TPA: kelch repeat-containing protein [Acidimicrobiales bacterium]|nr:kelch repeat-containing protein [Acidimicrobiales bacterium]